MTTEAQEHLFPFTTPDGELPPLNTTQVEYFKTHGTRGRLTEKFAATRTAGYIVINGEKVAWDEFERRARLAPTTAVQTVCVELDPDVAEAFPTAEAVNTALRQLIENWRNESDSGPISP